MELNHPPTEADALFRVKDLFRCGCFFRGSCCGNNGVCNKHFDCGVVKRGYGIFHAVVLKFGIDFFVIPMLLLCSVAHCDNLAEILVGGLEFFRIDDCHHNVLGLELTLSGLLIILAHIFNGKVCVFKVALEICAEGLKLLVEPVDLHVNLCGDDIAVNFNFRIVDDFLKDEVGALVLCSFGGALFKIAANVSGVFVNGGAF